MQTKSLHLSRRHLLQRTCAGTAAAVLGLPSWAATWPAGPVRIVVGNPAGGGPDTTSRAIADAMSRQLRQPVVVENRVGANGLIAFQAVQSAPADGRALCYFSQYMFYSMALMKRTDVLDGFDHVCKVSSSPSVLVVGEKSPHTTAAQLFDAIRKAPDKMNYGSGGIGSPAHVGMARLLIGTRTEMRHVPFKGGAEQAQALIAGEIDAGMVIPSAVKGLLETRRLRPLAVTSDQRLSIMPDVPTVAEALGLKDFDMSTWGAYLVRKGTPRETLQAIFDAVKAACADRVVVEAMSKTGTDLSMSSSPEDFSRYFAQERDAAFALVKQLGLAATS